MVTSMATKDYKRTTEKNFLARYLELESIFECASKNPPKISRILPPR